MGVRCAASQTARGNKIAEVGLAFVRCHPASAIRHWPSPVALCLACSYEPRTGVFIRGMGAVRRRRGWHARGSTHNPLNAARETPIQYTGHHSIGTAVYCGCDGRNLLRHCVFIAHNGLFIRSAGDISHRFGNVGSGQCSLSKCICHGGDQDVFLSEVHLLVR